MRLMKTLSAGAAAIALSTAFVATVPTPVMAQQTTSNIRGVVTDEAGAPIAGAQVTVTDSRTGVTRTIQTNNQGAYTAPNLPVGGPYEVSVQAQDYRGETVEQIFLTVGDTAAVSFDLSSGAEADVIVVTATRSNVADLAKGPSATFDLSDIQELPSISRDIKDVIRIDPRITIDETFGDGVYCVGSSNRSNSLTVDGVRQNDDFGLNANGFPTQRLPFPFDAAEQVSVEIAPFDVQYGGFTGCNINVVTRSGGNEFHGRAFFDYTDDRFVGKSVDGNQINQNLDLTEKSYGGVITGPILPDRVFFTFAYEKFSGGDINEDGPVGSGTVNETEEITQANLDEITSILQSVYGFDPLGQPSSLDVDDERFLVKGDFYLADGHRFEFTWQNTDGNSIVQSNNDAPDDELSLASQWYMRSEKLNSYSGRLFSDWTSNFSTELRGSFSQRDTGQDTLGDPDFASFEINGVGPNGLGTVFVGPDVFRHANRLENDQIQIRAAAYYTIGAHNFTLGYEWDQLDVFNLFVPFSQGEVAFDSVMDLENQTPSAIFYSNAASNNAEDGAASFKRSLHTFYLQDDIDVSPDLSVTLGLRYDMYTSGDEPTENPTFEQRYGFTNTANYDGISLIQPRIAATYDVNERLTVRGGFGRFSGGDPSVWISNSYSNPGFVGGAFSADPMVINGFNGFDIPAALLADNTAQASVGNGGVNVVDPDYTIPSVWRGSLGADYFADLSSVGLGDDWRLTADLLYTRTSNPNEWRDLTLQQVGTAPDGRPFYRSADLLDPDCQADPLDMDCSTRVVGGNGEMLLTNSDETPVSVTVSGSIGKEWVFDRSAIDLFIGYAYTRSEDVNPGTSSRAISNFENFSTDNFNFSSAAISNYSIKHAITARLNLEHEFIKDHPTSLTLFGFVQSGRPFSYTFECGRSRTTCVDGVPFNNNIFGDEDGSEDRSLLYVPLENDPSVMYAPGFDLAGFNAFIAENGLERGAIVGRNTQRSNWNGRLDVRFQQSLPAPIDGHALKFVVDIQNLTNLINDEWGLYREIGFEYNNPVVEASFDESAGQFVYEDFTGGFDQRINNGISIWQVQFGVRYEF